MDIRIQGTQRPDFVAGELSPSRSHRGAFKGDTLAGSGEKTSWFQSYCVAPFKRFFSWLYWIFTCCKKPEQDNPKEKTKVETQLEQLQELIDGFSRGGKGETFGIWWQSIFAELDEEVQNMIFAEDVHERQLKEVKESSCFVVELQNYLDVNKNEMIRPQDKIPGYLQRVKEKLEEKL